MADIDKRSIKKPMHERSKYVADMIKSHGDALTYIILAAKVLVIPLIVLVFGLAGPGFGTLWASLTRSGGPATDQTSRAVLAARAELRPDTKGKVGIYAALMPGADEGSRALLQDFREDLGRNGYHLTSSADGADMICELSGRVASRSNVPGAIVNANLTARWAATKVDYLVLPTSGNGIGSTPEAAATRAYRNAASTLFEQFDRFVQTGGKS